MNEDYPATIAGSVEGELIVRKSRFIARVEPVTSVTDADAVIAAARKRHWDARHHCTAMVTGLRGDQARSSDDGEPAGTAGIPMLEVLRKRNLTDVVTVVTRYFGGVKLGAGGLIRAYSGAVTEALDQARVVRRLVLTRARLTVPHADAGRYDNLLRGWAARTGAVCVDPEYGTAATLEVWIRPESIPDLAAEVASASAGSLTVHLGDERVVDVPD